mgnify:CR=1 FL=1
MEFVALSNEQLEGLAKQDEHLRRYFAGVFPANKLPKHPIKNKPQGYIVNTEKAGKEGMHWIALWTYGDVCEKLDSYALPLQVYPNQNIAGFISKHWKWIDRNGMSLQTLNSATCGHYALKYLIDRSKGKTMRQFLDEFTPKKNVQNDEKIAKWLKKRLLKAVRE